MADDNSALQRAFAHVESALLRVDLLAETLKEDGVPALAIGIIRAKLLAAQAELARLDKKLIFSELAWLSAPGLTRYERLVQVAVSVGLGVVTACLLLIGSVLMLPVALGLLIVKWARLWARQEPK
jgi:hypothetical protein